MEAKSFAAGLSCLTVNFKKSQQITAQEDFILTVLSSGFLFKLRNQIFIEYLLSTKHFSRFCKGHKEI